MNKSAAVLNGNGAPRFEQEGQTDSSWHTQQKLSDTRLFPPSPQALFDTCPPPASEPLPSLCKLIQYSEEGQHWSATEMPQPNFPRSQLTRRIQHSDWKSTCLPEKRPFSAIDGPSETARGIKLPKVLEPEPRVSAKSLGCKYHHMRV